MIDRRFCNYNLDYQQRLGFLKIVAHIGSQVRGGTEEILTRLRDIYPEVGRPSRGHIRDIGFDPDRLLKIQNVPSWQVGFSAKRLDRLVLWAEMIGIIAPTGRLSEWAIILKNLGKQQGLRETIDANPFILTLGEKALFIQLLLYHDQVFPPLLKRIAEIEADYRLNLNKCCILTIQSIGEFLDDIVGHSANEVQLRVEVRDVLERIAVQYGIKDPRAMQSTASRTKLLEELEKAPTRKKRPHLAEYHTVCRFEQLTDLGLLVKEDPKAKMVQDSELAKQRTAWSWFTTRRSASLADILGTKRDLENLIEKQWIELCSRTMGQPLTRLHPFDDQLELARYLDNALPVVRRQIGPVQLHSWATMASILAFENGFRVEIADITLLIEALHRDEIHGQQVRLGGRKAFKGLTVTMPSEGIGQLLQMRPLGPGGRQ